MKKHTSLKQATASYVLCSACWLKGPYHLCCCTKKGFCKLHPLASEAILWGKVISLKRQGVERENKMRDTNSNYVFESCSSCLQRTSLPKGKKLEKAFMLCWQRCHSSLAPLLKQEWIKDRWLRYCNYGHGRENQGGRNLPKPGWEVLHSMHEMRQNASVNRSGFGKIVVSHSVKALEWTSAKGLVDGTIATVPPNYEHFESSFVAKILSPIW